MYMYITCPENQNSFAVQSNIWDKQAEKEGPVGEKSLGKEQDGWPEWKEVRQSKRLRDNGTSHFKMGEQIQDRMATGLENEGNLTVLKSSAGIGLLQVANLEVC
ncbi:uncharacterized protein [Miscanthus floridulus]|uniref:uncharacterized protein n=1 Tax=Miscanthus floridulus TaxID=154761 RepID=UPI00345B1019